MGIVYPLAAMAVSHRKIDITVLSHNNERRNPTIFESMGLCKTGKNLAIYCRLKIKRPTATDSVNVGSHVTSNSINREYLLHYMKVLRNCPYLAK